MTNTKKYNKFYFLHINKTGGRYLTQNVIDPIKNELHKNGILHIVEPHSHSGWHSQIDKNTYVVAILRNTVQQTVSLYAHKISLDDSGNLKNKYNKNKINKKDFFEWLYNENLYPNFQTKNFLCNEFFLKKDHFKNKLNVKLNFDENLLNVRKNQVNLFLNTNNIDGRGLEIQKKIFLDLGINGTTKLAKEKKIFFNEESKKLYNMLSNEEKEIIRKYNIKDDNFYTNTVFF
jgi:hypothetical protein